MLVGIPVESKSDEARVGMTPDGVRTLVDHGHAVRVQRCAGIGAGFADDSYVAAGATLVDRASEAFEADLIVKVKELQAGEAALVPRGAIVFCFQQLALIPSLLDAALASGASYIAYETVEDGSGGLPLLAPMSRIAGCLAPQIGAIALMRGVGDPRGSALQGSGVMLAATGDAPPAKVVVIGAGAAGSEAVRVACSLGAEVTVFAKSALRFAALKARCAAPVRCEIMDTAKLAALLPETDLVIGAVLTPGSTSPTLITRAMLSTMCPGSVLIDIGIDQRGIAETSRPTTLADPMYVEEGVLHYAVPNLPALVPRSATLALTQATLPYVLALADRGLAAALADDAGLLRGLQLHRQAIVDARLARDTGRPCEAYRRDDTS